MLLSKTAKVKLYGKAIKYYQDKGYQGKHGDEIDVKVEDLPPNSHAKVLVKCDYDGTIVEKQWDKYLEGRKVIEKDCCNNRECWQQKVEECNIEKYGVKSSWEREEVQEKKKATTLEHYGVENVLMSEEIQEKSRQTRLQKYGSINIWDIPGTKEKAKATNLKKYGVENPNQNPEIRAKVEKTNMERYGSKSPFGNKEIQEKFKETMRNKYGVDNPFFIPGVWQKAHDKTISAIYSSQQAYLCDLYGGELNIPISFYFIDIFFKEDGICLEYDGTGHNLSVRRGNLTQEEFDRKEIIRYQTLKRMGYKQSKIIKTKNDNLPSDEILLYIKEIMFNYLLSDIKDNYYIYFYIDEKKIKTHNGEYEWDYKNPLKIDII